MSCSSSPGACASSPTTPASAPFACWATAGWSARSATRRTSNDRHSPSGLSGHLPINGEDHLNMNGEEQIGKIRADLEAQLGTRVTSLEPIPEGHSGFTYFVTADSGEFVLRLPPPNARISGTADVVRPGR